MGLSDDGEAEGGEGDGEPDAERVEVDGAEAVREDEVEPALGVHLEEGPPCQTGLGQGEGNLRVALASPEYPDVKDVDEVGPHRPCTRADASWDLGRGGDGEEEEGTGVADGDEGEEGVDGGAHLGPREDEDVGSVDDDAEHAEHQGRVPVPHLPLRLSQEGQAGAPVDVRVGIRNDGHPLKRRRLQTATWCWWKAGVG